MTRKTIGIILAVKAILLAFFGIPILFALYQIRKLASNNEYPRQKPSEPFYE